MSDSLTSVGPSGSGKASFWSITINNPTPLDYEQIELLKSQEWFKRFQGQLEKGDQNGTLHVQAYLETKYGRYLQKIRTALPRAHVEVARKPAALVQYVQKAETRVAQLPQLKTKVATQADLQEEMYSTLLYNGSYYFNNWIVAQDFFLENLSRYKEDIRRLWEHILDDAVKKLITDGYYGIEFVVSNNQVRTAFKKYLPEIIFRTHMEHLERVRLQEQNNMNTPVIEDAPNEESSNASPQNDAS